MLVLVSCSQLVVVERWSSLSNGRVAASWVGRLLSLWEKVNLLSRPGIPLGSQSSLAREVLVGAAVLELRVVVVDEGVAARVVHRQAPGEVLRQRPDTAIELRREW